MVGHNCRECRIKGKCPMEHLAGVLNKYEAETKAARDAEVGNLVIIASQLCEFIDEGVDIDYHIVQALKFAFYLGYAHCRQDIDLAKLSG